MTDAPNQPVLHLGLPKGRMQDQVLELMAEAGLRVTPSRRGYRPQIALDKVETKILKPQNIVEMLGYGSRDIGFAGADWVDELNVDVVELIDTELNPVRLVAAAPVGLVQDGQMPAGPLVVASEYERLTRRWIKTQGIDGNFIRAYGATEVFPPEDADIIVDNTATGETLRDNRLEIVDELMQSSTRFYASRAAYEDGAKRQRIDDICLLLRSVIEGRRRVMVEVNVAADALDRVIDALPAMQRPTVAPLHNESGYAVRAAVLRKQLPAVIPKIKAHGGRDIVVSSLKQIVA